MDNTSTTLKIASQNSEELNTNNATLNPNDNSKEHIYVTTYKKGSILGKFNFAHHGDLMEAVAAVRKYCRDKGLRHIHTTPFLINLEHDNMDQMVSGN